MAMTSQQEKVFRTYWNSAIKTVVKELREKENRYAAICKAEEYGTLAEEPRKMVLGLMQIDLKRLSDAIGEQYEHECGVDDFLNVIGLKSNEPL